MANELVAISPEGLEIANKYLELGSPEQVSLVMGVPVQTVVELINTRQVKKYIDTVYFDRGYRNRNKIGELLDRMIESKLEEAEESGIYTKKDLAELLVMAHKMRMEELKAINDANKTNISKQTNVQINNSDSFGEGNYGSLMKKLMDVS